MNQKTLGFMDLKEQFQSIKPEIMAAIEKVLDETAVSGGPYVDAFEKEFSKYCGVNHTIGLSNGTSALHLGLKALDIGAGDEVIVPASTFVATAWGPAHCGATPVFADSDPDTWNLSVSSVAKKITKKTKAIIGVHLYGAPCDVHGLKALAADAHIPFIEDAAQAHGALVDGKIVGSFGKIACFSFYPGKNLGAYGEAGAVTTNDPLIAKRIEGLRNHGSQIRYYHDEVGYNERMDGIQGAVLSIKLKHLNDWTEKRRKIGAKYLNEFSNAKIKAQKVPENFKSAYHLFVVMTQEKENLVNHLKAHGINAGFHYPVPCHLQKAFAHLGYKVGDFPNAEALSSQCLSLPMYPELNSEDQARVIVAINSF